MAGIEDLLKDVNLVIVKRFLFAVESLVNALLLAEELPREARMPQEHDYTKATLPREAPPLGWLSHDQLRESARQMGEAISAEKWTDGFVAAIRLISLFTGAL